jgi:hypothetical protein
VRDGPCVHSHCTPSPLFCSLRSVFPVAPGAVLETSTAIGFGAALWLGGVIGSAYVAWCKPFCTSLARCAAVVLPLGIVLLGVLRWYYGAVWNLAAGPVETAAYIMLNLGAFGGLGGWLLWQRAQRGAGWSWPYRPDAPDSAA